MPRAAVVVPVHDGAATLKRCLSALEMRPPDVDLLVVDDASTDGSAEIARRLGVRVIVRAQRGGSSAARNTGVAATDAPVVVFVDADVVVRPDAIARLLDRLDAAPALRGANGLLSLDQSTPGLVTAFANTSIHYQHLRHGAFVATAFTSLCAIRRGALEVMGGWDERTSRFADDVATRWALPPASIALEPSAQGEHLKAVHFAGLLRHRARVGCHFVASVADHWRTALGSPARTVLAPRYPLNTLVASVSVIGFPSFLVWPGLLFVPATLFILINLPFALFTLRERGRIVEALAAIPISAQEGFAYALGIGVAGMKLLWRRLGASAPARPLCAPVRPRGAGE